MRGAEGAGALVSRLPARLLRALDGLSRAGSTWSITMADDYYRDAAKLESLGLVRFVRRLNRRGQPDGHDVVLTADGKVYLLSE